MNFLIILKVSLRSLWRTLLRSGLTALGIVIGVAAVIAMVSIGNGARARVQDALASVDTDLIHLTAGPPRITSQGSQPGIDAGAHGLNLDDYAAIQKDVGGIRQLSAVVPAPSGEVRANGRRSRALAAGYDSAGLSVYRREIIQGAAFGHADVDSAASVCLVSKMLANALFDELNPLGRRIYLGNVPFIVIGVMKNKEIKDPLNGSIVPDNSIVLPYTSILRRLNPKAPLLIVFRVRDPVQLPLIRRQIADVMESRRGKRKAEFKVGSSAGAVQAYTDGSKTMAVLLTAIGSISLLVGGIGIMNIMLVNVTERTREIGIRLAIGTRERDVLLQFLIEACVLSLAGGAIGIGLGMGVAKILTFINQWPTEITLSSVLIAFLGSAAIGIFFGYYPARQAARLDPIQALRAE